MKAEQCSNEGKISDLTRENQRLKQDVLQEKFEREKARQEFKKIGCLSQTPPISPRIVPSPTAGRNLHNTSTQTVVSSVVSGRSGAPNGSPRKRVPVAARFATAETQTVHYS